MRQVRYIYKITNKLTGQIYIGQTKNIKSRIEVYRNCRCNTQHLIYKSIKHYGWENHKFEIIYRTTSTKEEIDNIEILFIKEFCCYYYDYKTYGLNLKRGGGGADSPSNRKGVKLSQETIDKIKNNRKGIPHTEETKKKMSDSQKKVIKFYSKESREKITKTMKELSRKRWDDPNYIKKVCKVIIQLDLRGNFIRETNSRELNIEGFDTAAIRRCCRGLVTKSCGFIWRYKNCKSE